MAAGHAPSALRPAARARAIGRRARPSAATRRRRRCRRTSRPVAGTPTTPSTGRPSRTRPIFTAKSSPPSVNSRVPSSGSTSQNSAVGGGDRPAGDLFLGDHRAAGQRLRADPARMIASAAWSASVTTRPVGLALDLEIRGRGWSADRRPGPLRQVGRQRRQRSDRPLRWLSWQRCRAIGFRPADRGPLGCRSFAVLDGHSGRRSVIRRGRLRLAAGYRSQAASAACRPSRRPDSAPASAGRPAPRGQSSAFAR